MYLFAWLRHVVENGERQYRRFIRVKACILARTEFSKELERT